MLTLHRTLGTYSRHIDRYIALTQFARGKMLKGGIAEEKIVVKPNFLPAPPAVGNGAGGGAIFVGRLLEGKGAETLVAAWRSLPSIRLKIVGDGALRPQLESTARREGLNIEFTGMQRPSEVLQAIAGAKLLIIPSEWYEGFPMVIAESFACGTPVLASRIGSLDELVQDGVTGLKFDPGNADDLARGVLRMLGDEVALRRMRINARAYFERELTEQQNFLQLTGIYSDVIDAAGRNANVRRA